MKKVSERILYTLLFMEGFESYLEVPKVAIFACCESVKSWMVSFHLYAVNVSFITGSFKEFLTFEKKNNVPDF